MYELDRGGRRALALQAAARARAHALRRPRRRGRAAAPGTRPGRRRPRADGRRRGRGRGGKSRLYLRVHPLAPGAGLADPGGPSVSYGKATSYLPVIDLLKGYFKIGDGDDHREMRAKVLGRVLGLDRALEPLLAPAAGAARCAGRGRGLAGARPAAAPPAHAGRGQASAVAREPGATAGRGLRGPALDRWRDPGGDLAAHPDRSEADSAEAHYRQALALAEELGLRALVAHCHLGLAKLFRRTGQRDQAHEHLTTATTLYREMDMRFWLEQAEVEMKALE